MKYLVLIILLFFVTQGVAFAQDDSKLPISVETRTFSDGARGISEIVVIPHWSPVVSSEFAIRRVSDTAMGPAIDSDPKTLLAVQYSRWEAELQLFKERTSLFKDAVGAGLSLGFGWWNENELQKGYFSFGGDAQLMADSTRINYFIPILGGNLDARLGKISISDECWYTPVFYYSMNQSIAIQPLVDQQYTQTVQGWGKMMVGNDFRIDAFGFLNLSWQFDLTLLDFPFLKLGSDGGVATFYPSKSPAETINHKLMAGFSLPFGNQVLLIVRAGANFSTAINIDTDISIEKKSFVWEAALSFK
jgi:hypothetical protein